MPYPYGMQNSPVVGNGLGGLPRRATAAAAVTAAQPIVLQKVGDFVTFRTTSGDVSAVYGGRILGDNGGTVIFRYRWNNGVDQPNFGGCTYSDSGITASLTGVYTTTINSYFYSNSWSYGDSVYFYDCTNIYRVYVSGGSVAFATAKSSAVPQSGTLTVGGASYSIDLNFTLGVIGENSSLCSMTKMSGGQVLYVCNANVSGTAQWLVGFVLDSSFNIVRSFPIVQIHTSTSTIHKRVLVIPVSGAVDTFTVCGILTTGTTLKQAYATFNASTGSVTTSKTATRGITDQNSLSTSTSFLITPSSIVIFYIDVSSSVTYRITVPANSDASINSTASYIDIISYSQLNMNDRYYDSQYNDFVTMNASGNMLLDAPVYASGTGNFTSYVTIVANMTAGTYTSSTTNANVTALTTKCVNILENENTTTSDQGYGPTVFARVGERTFIGWSRDTNSSIPQYRGNLQLLRA